MSIKSVDAGTLKRWLDDGEALLLDVREPAEHASEKIPGAALLPLGKVSRETLPDLAGRKLVIHCKGGRRGGSACEKLLAEAPDLELYNLEGGLDAWRQAGGEVEASERDFLPLDRQVQLAIGLAVLAGTALGYFVHPGFLLLAGFFGLGLINAGLTGWCGLALLMAKMPWNQKTSTCCKGSCHA